LKVNILYIKGPNAPKQSPSTPLCKAFLSGTKNVVGHLIVSYILTYQTKQNEQNKQTHQNKTKQKTYLNVQIFASNPIGNDLQES